MTPIRRCVTIVVFVVVPQNDEIVHIVSDGGGVSLGVDSQMLRERMLRGDAEAADMASVARRFRMTL